MVIDLTACLLAEIERREDYARYQNQPPKPWVVRDMAYLAALRTVVESMDYLGNRNIARHKVIAAVAEALGMDA